jgi:hypothetical protein
MPLLTTREDDGAPELLQGYRFTPMDLAVAARRPGLSAFMRIRNGAEFLEAAVRSHLPYFDEIVAVYNQCTDATPEILLRLRQAFPHKLRVIHYTDRVFPPGSEGHAATPPDSPQSLVNYYNAALAATAFQVATKLDDDHVAIAETTRALTDRLRRDLAGGQAMAHMGCFSGLNLVRGPQRELGILAATPISGAGDIGFFPVRPGTYFVHDRRFERFRRDGLPRRFEGFLYWHLKYLKAEMGFANYELEANPDSRYARRRRALREQGPTLVDVHDLPRFMTPSAADRLAALLLPKKRLKLERNAAIEAMFPDADTAAAVRRTVAPEFAGTMLN